MKKGFFLTIDESGRILVPQDVQEQYGLKPGGRLFCEAGEDTVLLHRPLSALTKLYIEPTTLCNLSCRTCIRNIWDEKIGHMPEDVWARVIGQISGLPDLKTVFFGGFGEPLVHPLIFDMVKQVKGAGKQAELITNGILLDETAADRLIDARLDRIWVSLDGASPEGYEDIRKDDQIGSITGNINRLLAFKSKRGLKNPELGISFVAMKRNFHELPDVLGLAHAWKAYRVMVTNVLPYNKELKNEVLYTKNIWNWQYQLDRIDFPRMDMVNETLPTVEKLLRRYELPELSSAGFSEPWDTCPFVERGSMSVRLNKSYSVGSVLSGTLEEIWKDPGYRDLREKLSCFDFSPCSTCNSCELPEDNLEDCFGSEHPACGGCLWAQGFIRRP